MKKRNDKTECKSDLDGNYLKLVQSAKEAVRDLLRENKSVMTLQKKYYEQIDSKKKRFFVAVSECNMMKKAAVDYVKGVLRLIITERFGINGTNVDNFLNDCLKSPKGNICRFYMLLRQYGELDALMEEKGLVVENAGLSVITDESLADIFERFYIAESFVGKTDILVQMIYQELFGLGIVDSLIEQPFDSIMGGTSNGGEDEKSLWVQYKGRNIYFQFAAFGNKEELERKGDRKE